MASEASHTSVYQGLVCECDSSLCCEGATYVQKAASPYDMSCIYMHPLCCMNMLDKTLNQLAYMEVCRLYPSALHV